MLRPVRVIVVVVLSLLMTGIAASDTVYQYAVASSTADGKPVTAYCWVPPRRSASAAC